jgi:hypothetical protein
MRHISFSSVLDMNWGRTHWPDSRLDDVTQRIDAEMRGLRADVSALHRTLIHAVIGIMAAMLTGFAGLAGLIVTQL